MSSICDGLRNWSRSSRRSMPKTVLSAPARAIQWGDDAPTCIYHNGRLGCGVVWRGVVWCSCGLKNVYSSPYHRTGSAFKEPGISRLPSPNLKQNWKLTGQSVSNSCFKFEDTFFFLAEHDLMRRSPIVRKLRCGEVPCPGRSPYQTYPSLQARPGYNTKCVPSPPSLSGPYARLHLVL